MIASVRGVIVVVMIGLALAVVAVIDRVRATGPVDRALVPGFDGGHALAWDGGARIARDATGSWRFADGAAADRDTIDTVMAALRGARWQREAPREAAGAIVATVHVDADAIAVGQPLAGTAQTWLVKGDRALLVDTWVARALAIEPWQLRARHPLAGVDADGATITIAIGGEVATLSGAPRRRGKTWVDVAKVEAFARAARDLAIVGPGPGSESESVSVSVSGSGSVIGGGPCLHHPDQIAIAQGCVTATAWTALVDAATTLVGSTSSIADPRPLPLAPTAIQLDDGTIVLAKPAHVERTAGSSPLDPAAATELIAALSTPGVVLPPRERAPIIAHHLVATTAGGPIELRLVAPDLVARDDYVMLRIGTGAYAILARGARSYVARALWAEEPTTITRVVIDGVAYTRGAVVGEWSGGTAAVVTIARSGSSIERYVTALARVTALDADPPPTFAIAHHVAIDVEAPDGRRETHALELGTPTATGCPARAPSPVLLPSTLCAPPK